AGPLSSFSDSGNRSNSATPITAPAENPRIKCSLSRKRSANKPPSIVAANAMAEMRRTVIALPPFTGGVPPKAGRGASCGTRPLHHASRGPPPPQAEEETKDTATSLRSGVVWRFAGDDHVVHMTLAHAGAGDADELGILVEVGNRAATGVAHRRAQASDDLVHDIGHRSLERHLPFH